MMAPDGPGRPSGDRLVAVSLEPAEPRVFDSHWWAMLVKLAVKSKATVTTLVEVAFAGFKDQMSRRAEARTRILEADARIREARADVDQSEAEVSRAFAQAVSAKLVGRREHSSTQTEAQRRAEEWSAEQIVKQAMKNGTLQIDQNGMLHVLQPRALAATAESTRTNDRKKETADDADA